MTPLNTNRISQKAAETKTASNHDITTANSSFDLRIKAPHQIVGTSQTNTVSTHRYGTSSVHPKGLASYRVCYVKRQLLKYKLPAVCQNYIIYNFQRLCRLKTPLPFSRNVNLLANFYILHVK